MKKPLQNTHATRSFDFCLFLIIALFFTAKRKCGGGGGGGDQFDLMMTLDS